MPLAGSAGQSPPFRLRVKALPLGLAVAAATAWWLVPLLLLGRFSPPFLDYIETARVTTTPTDTVTVLRGASHWHAYLNGAFGPPWAAGWRLATEQPLVIATLVVAGLGVAGLARRGMPHRRFLITGRLVGLALVGVGHVGTVDGLGAATQRAFLDGVGAPLRNVHKFDVVLRLPLILGLAHLVGLVLRAVRVADRPDLDPGLPRLLQPVRLRAGLVTGTALMAVAAVASPALAGGLAAQGSFREVPGYWQQRLLAGPQPRRERSRGARRPLPRTSGAARATRSPSRSWRAPGGYAARCRSPRRAPSGCSTPSSRRWPGARARRGWPTCSPAPASATCCSARTWTSGTPARRSR
jgi:hypothetical protein